MAFQVLTHQARQHRDWRDIPPGRMSPRSRATGCAGVRTSSGRLPNYGPHVKLSAIGRSSGPKTSAEPNWPPSRCRLPGLGHHRGRDDMAPFQCKRSVLPCPDDGQQRELAAKILRRFAPETENIQYMKARPGAGNESRRVDRLGVDRRFRDGVPLTGSWSVIGSAGVRIARSRALRGARGRIRAPGLAAITCILASVRRLAKIRKRRITLGW